MNDLRINNLTVSFDNKVILKDINLLASQGKVTALLGPNGSGKTTLVNSVMGHPDYKIEAGSILFNNVNITTSNPTERAKLGLFLSFQNPSEIPGVSVANFLRIAYNARTNSNIAIDKFMNLLNNKLEELNFDKSFAYRSINEGFSGGEKKKLEILQLLIFQPKFAILDEADSGMDVDALRIIGNSINKIIKSTNMGVLLITHHNKIINYIKPESVFIMFKGKIIKEGGKEIIKEVEEQGYKEIQQITM